MTYEEIVAKAKKEFGSADVSNYEGHPCPANKCNG